MQVKHKDLSSFVYKVQLMSKEPPLYRLFGNSKKTIKHKYLSLRVLDTCAQKQRLILW